MFNILKFLRGLKIVPKSGVSQADAAGEIEVLSSNNKLTYHNGTSTSPVVTEAHTATLTNKTFDANGTGNVLSNVETDNLATGVLNTSSTLADATDLQIPSALAVKTVTDAITADVQDDVEGPASSTDNAITRFDGTTGKLIKNSVITASDAGVVSGVTQLNVDNVRVDGNTISSTDTNGDVTITPNGEGILNVTSGIKSSGVEIHTTGLLDQSGSNVAVIVDPRKNYRMVDPGLVSISSIEMSSGTPQSGQEITLINVTSSTVTLNNLAGGDYDIRTGTGANVSIPDGKSATLVYNSNEDAWYVTAISQNALEVPNTPSGNLAATNVQGALNELQSDIDTRATSTELNTEITNRTNADTTLQDNIDAEATARENGDTAVQDNLDDHADLTAAHGATGAVVGTTNTQTLTNKTLTEPVLNSPEIVTPSRLDPKLDTLANLTTYAATASNGQLAFSTDTKELYKIVDGALVPASGSAGTTALSVTTKTANYTALTTDDVIIVDGTSGAFAITLYSASGNSGKVLTIKRTDSTYANVVSITGTIDGATDWKLHTPGETYRIVSNGTTWTILDHDTDTGWIAFPSVAYGTLITTTGTAASYGTVANNNAYWKRVNGTDVMVRWDYRHSTLGTAGTGAYLLNVPSYLALASSVIVNTGTAAAPANFDSFSIGSFKGVYGTSTMISGHVAAYSTTQIKALVFNGSSAAVWGPTVFDFANAAIIFSMQFQAPVAGWKP